MFWLIVGIVLFICVVAVAVAMILGAVAEEESWSRGDWEEPDE